MSFYLSRGPEKCRECTIKHAERMSSRMRAARQRIEGPDAAVLNGVQTVSVQHGQHAQGPFALQFGNGPNDALGGAIKWRKVQIRPL